MANYANLEAAIQAAIYENNTNDVTGAALQTVLLQMVSDMGKSGMLCNGVCDGNTVPPVAPDSNIFYIAPTGTYSNFGGLTVADGEWAIFIYNGSWQKQSIPVVTADAVPTTGSTNPVQSGGVADALEQKADIDGYYSTLTAGSAENLIGRGTVPAEYTRRTSGGSADIGSGAAAIEKIHGNTIVWNQLLQTHTSYWGIIGFTGVVSDNVVTLTANTGISSNARIEYRTSRIGGTQVHNYIVKVSCKSSKATRVTSYIAGAFGESIDISANTRVDLTMRVPATGGNDEFGVYFNYSSSLSAGDTVEVYGVKVFDLTQMGLSSLTASEFAMLFPRFDYAYNTGSLVSLTGTGISTNGFNQCVEQPINRAATTFPAFDATKYSRVFGGIQYYLCHSALPVANWRHIYKIYDLEGNEITANAFTSIDLTTYYSGGEWLEGTNNTHTSRTMTFAQDCYVYFGFEYGGVIATTPMPTDFNLNISWSGYRNGEYEAYWDSTLALPITTVTSGGSAIFSDGMKSAGSVYDELTSSKAVKRIGIVDLGSLAWDYDGTYKRFYATLTGSKRPADNSLSANMLGAIYTTTNFNAFLGDTTLDKTVAHPYNNDTIQIRNLAYTTAAAFTTAMNGVYLVYELDTPVEYTLDSEVNLNYRVDDFGTETLLPQNNATPTTAPIIYDVRYAMNAVDTLRNLPKNYISKDSMEHILTAMVTAGVISAYTLTWNTSNENYDCTITA